MSYKIHLQYDETLDDLCERLKTKSQLIALINDLLTFNLTALSKHGYFKPNRFESPKEGVIRWLCSSPFYVRKTGVTVFNKLFIQAIENEDWELFKIILTTTNANKYGVSQRYLAGPFEEKLPEINELEIYLTLLNLQKEHKTIANIEKYWKRKLPLAAKPYLSIVFVNIFIKSSPKKSLQYFKELAKFQKNPPNRTFRLIYLANLKVTLLNLIDFYNKAEKENEKEVQFFITWSYSINNFWLNQLTIDVLNLKRLEGIKERILEFDSGFLEDLILPRDLPTENFDKEYKERMADIPGFLSELTGNFDNNQFLN